MGDSDLSAAGDTAFRDSRMPRVHAYVEEVCAPGLSDEAADAAFVDFLARAPREPVGEQELERVLLAATRSAAAGRFAVNVPMGRPELALTAECRAMPELLAAHANGEREGDEGLIGAHLARCAICAHTLDRMHRAERAFARGSHGLPELEIEETSVDTSKAGTPLAGPAPTSAPAASNPLPQPDTSPRQAPPRGRTVLEQASPASPGAPLAGPRAHRRRSGGLVGAIRKLGR